MQLKQLLFGGLLLATFSVAAVPANAQAGRFGINAGVNFANINGKDAEGTKLKTGFQAGVTYDIGLSDEFVLQPGISYVQNGSKVKGDEFDARWDLNYIQVPVTFQYQPAVGTGNLLLGVGPYVGFGVGKIKTKAYVEGANNKASMDWKDMDFKKFDAGGKLLVGYQLGMGLSFNLNANLGLANLSDNKDEKLHNTSFGVTVGYKF
ncbi:hypothetical protein PIECOFPK_01468 [Mycovorax composti]|uniref:Outer membrane protein beta-barrel domain-containing protein n=1 Tax=Mycovorax composti TaxID=2962693 RepID=A0ABZ2EJR6_9BACT